MRYENEMLEQFAKDVRSAGEDESLPIPWDEGMTLMPHAQASVVALYENGMLSSKPTIFGEAFYCSSKPYFFTRIRGLGDSIVMLVLIVAFLFSLASIATKTSDFVGLVVASVMAASMFLKASYMSMHWYLYSSSYVTPTDPNGRIRDATAFFTYCVTAGVAIYFYRRVFYLDVYKNGGSSLWEGLSRTLGDGLWFEWIKSFLMLDTGSWWQYLIGVVLVYFFFAIFLGKAGTLAANPDACRKLYRAAGMDGRASAMPEKSGSGPLGAYVFAAMVSIVCITVMAMESWVGKMI